MTSTTPCPAPDIGANGNEVATNDLVINCPEKKKALWATLTQVSSKRHLSSPPPRYQSGLGYCHNQGTLLLFLEKDLTTLDPGPCLLLQLLLLLPLVCKLLSLIPFSFNRDVSRRVVKHRESTPTQLQFGGRVGPARSPCFGSGLHMS